MKHRLDFPFENKFKTIDIMPKMHGQKKLLKQRLDFSFENKIETMDRFPKIQGQKIVETTVGFSI